MNGNEYTPTCDARFDDPAASISFASDEVSFRTVSDTTHTENDDECKTGESTIPDAPEDIRKFIAALLAQRLAGHDSDNDVVDVDALSDCDEDDDDEDDEDDEVDEECDDTDDDDDLEEQCETQDEHLRQKGIGKRVILRSDYKSNTAYCNAVVHSMQAILRSKGIYTQPRKIQNGVYVFAFDKFTSGCNATGYVLCEYEICNFRIEYKIIASNLPDRVPLIDQFCQDKNYSLRYGTFTMDHSDGEKKIEYSSCFYGAFSEEAFERYFDALSWVLSIYGEEYATLASKKKLPTDKRKDARAMISELANNLPSNVRPEREEVFHHAEEALGGNLSTRIKKLLIYIVSHIEQ